jgi:TPP-dependent indolepyruvate ferredoxin oxidoreductase alpha subunit
MLAASVNYPIRGAVTFNSPVGINVASDAIANLASGGVTGGALIISGEDYGEGSSIMQERSHPYAMKSQVGLLDPRPNLPSIVKAVEDGFELSEVSHTPVMLEVRIRACHVHGRFIAKDNKRPSLSLREALENPRRDTERVVLPPASATRPGGMNRDIAMNESSVGGRTAGRLISLKVAYRRSGHLEFNPARKRAWAAICGPLNSHPLLYPCVPPKP